MKKCNKDLLRVGKNTDMCILGKKAIKNAKDTADLVETTKEFLMWQIKKNYPGEDILMKHFDGFKNEWCAVNVDGAEFRDQRIVRIECGAKAIATYSSGKRGRLFVRHNSTLTIKACRASYCVVSLYDNSKVKIEVDEGAKVYVFLHDTSTIFDTHESKQILIRKR